MKTTLGLVLLAMIAVGAAATAFADDMAKDRIVASGAHKGHGSKLPLARPKLDKTDASRLNNNANQPDYYTIQRESQMKNSM